MRVRFRSEILRALLVAATVAFWWSCAVCAVRAADQAIPYTQSFAKPKEEVQKALTDLQAYTGQKLPIVDGFAAAGDQPLDRYERAYYQYSIELLPGTTAGETIVRISAKITAWYNDRDPSKSGYQVLPSSGRLEMDLLDRLAEKLGTKTYSSILKPEAPRPRSAVFTGSNGFSVRPSGPMSPSAEVGSNPGDEEIAKLSTERGEEEKHVQQLTAELKSLQNIQTNQAHPNNLVVVKKAGTPVLARPADGARLLFNAAADDEFEYIDGDSAWIHVQISGESRGYLRRAALELPDAVAARLDAQSAAPGAEKASAFRIEREDYGAFPADWETLKGKAVKIYTVAPESSDPKETGAAAKLRYAATLFGKLAGDISTGAPPVEGVAVIFDSADGGMIGCPLRTANQIAKGSAPQENLWKLCYMDPPDAFKATAPSAPTSPAKKN